MKREKYMGHKDNFDIKLSWHKLQFIYTGPRFDKWQKTDSAKKGEKNTRLCPEGNLSISVKLLSKRPNYWFTNDWFQNICFQNNWFQNICFRNNWFQNIWFPNNCFPNIWFSNNNFPNKWFQNICFLNIWFQII